ncbi:unnamed protein product [Microthlaspi erraticum]|uniref:Uncharacterized protein n=1 Tax=Microthlaspi erraticum TaxID=1685480 RepID=A0A6D2HY68_9BRAS|nr:unnamed protein product [Microthlaspi erraticum]CAA7054594.1 unnamed protein product [Microthlaspi erraticum]
MFFAYRRRRIQKEPSSSPPPFLLPPLKYTSVSHTHLSIYIRVSLSLILTLFPFLWTFPPPSLPLSVVAAVVSHNLFSLSLNAGELSPFHYWLSLYPPQTVA